MRSPIRSSRNAAATRTYHPAWDKVYGDPSDPATSIVFGEKGSGKTAMRMQMVGRIALYNARPQNGRLFVIEYDDFNPFLDHFADRLSARKQRDPAKVLAEWKLWDHMDAILSLGVTSLVDRLLGVPQPSGPTANQISADRLRSLDRHQKRDLLLLAACYDNSTRENVVVAVEPAAPQTAVTAPGTSWWDRVLGVAVTAAVVGDDRLFAEMGLARHALAVRDRRARLAAVARAAVEMALGRPADCPQCPRAQAARRARCAGC